MSPLISFSFSICELFVVCFLCSLSFVSSLLLLHCKIMHFRYMLRSDCFETPKNLQPNQFWLFAFGFPGGSGICPKLLTRPDLEEHKLLGSEGLAAVAVAPPSTETNVQLAVQNSPS